MAAAPDSDSECDALLAAAGLEPSQEDRADLHKAYRSLAVMKARVRGALMWASETAHVFTPMTGGAADRRTTATMDTIPTQISARPAAPRDDV